MKDVALGKLPSRHDPRTLRMSKYLTGPVTPAPSSRAWAPEWLRWRMFGNDKIGCCTVAAQAHIIQLWGAASGFNDIAPADADVDVAYRAISGYDGTPDTDRGAVMVDALNRWRKFGLGGHKIYSYVKLDAGDRAQIMAAINLFGAVYLGAQLPMAIRGRPVWTAPGNQAMHHAEWRVGSWGGHTMASHGYSSSGIFLATWAETVHASWQWLMDYCDEMYVVLGPEWADENRPSPGGFTLDALRADLARLDS
jgi:hypothetical protein